MSYFIFGIACVILFIIIAYWRADEYFYKRFIKIKKESHECCENIDSQKN